MPDLHDVSRPFPFPARPAAGALALSALLMLAACGKGEAPAAGAGGPKMPAPEVGVVVATPGDVGLLIELPGRLEASRVAQVRARAAGILQKRLFREGSDVKAGQPLFQHRPRALPGHAVERRRPALARAAGQRWRRPRRWPSATSRWSRPTRSASRTTPTRWRPRRQAEADVAVGQAALQTAQINLGYATVTAPISGRIGRALVTEGALVGQGEATQLAMIQQINPMYVNFTQSASRRAAAAPGAAKRPVQARQRRRGAPACACVLEDGSEYPQAGQAAVLRSRRSTRPPARSRCAPRCPTRSGLLLPGLYVRVRLEQAQAEQRHHCAAAGRDAHAAGRHA